MMQSMTVLEATSHHIRQWCRCLQQADVDKVELPSFYFLFNCLMISLRPPFANLKYIAGSFSLLSLVNFSYLGVAASSSSSRQAVLTSPLLRQQKLPTMCYHPQVLPTLNIKWQKGKDPFVDWQEAATFTLRAVCFALGAIKRQGSSSKSSSQPNYSGFLVYDIRGWDFHHSLTSSRSRVVCSKYFIFYILIYLVCIS